MRLTLSALIGCTLTLFSTSAWSAPNRDDVTAAMIYRLTKFVEWPDHAFPTEQDNFLICFDGPSPVFKKLSEARLKRWKGRAIRVESEMRSECHVAVRARPQAASVQQTWALQVTLDQNIYKTDGHVLLDFRRGRIEFRVNRTHAERTGIQFSSEFLSLAREIR